MGKRKEGAKVKRYHRARMTREEYRLSVASDMENIARRVREGYQRCPVCHVPIPPRLFERHTALASY